ncbi:MAG: cytochrome c biogenesis protein ResB [Planctomycetes bacterium]|nr:cytochrome c biogenesis protein ResB [Planctomycetota bacterium]
MNAATATPSANPSTTRPTAPAPARSPLRLVFDLLASMKLTVVLMGLLALLTLTGTLAQTVDGIYYVQKQYFESWGLWANVSLGDDLTVPVPLPGAVPVLGLLFVNLLVGGIARMRWRQRNLGILTAHFGIALLLVAGYVKLSVSFSGHLSLPEGAIGSTIRSFQEWELALLWQEGDQVFERTIPGATIENATGPSPVRLTGEGLPFMVDVSYFQEHCTPALKTAMFQSATPVVDGVCLVGDPKLIGTWPKDRDNRLAGCYVQIVENGARGAMGMLWAPDLLPTNVAAPHRPWAFEAGGRKWGLELRHKVWNLPYDLRLDKFRKSEHPGTTMARDFSSFVTVLEPGSMPREAHIYMNEPLRKDGFVFYQTSFGPDPKRPGKFYSTFEVANNPSDKWPEWSCYVIGIGLLGHFIWKLSLFIAAENRRRHEYEVRA